jgi:hypothetical protein
MHYPLCRYLSPPQNWPPTLTVVIDTEEEFDWLAPFDPQATATTNIQYQPLAQRIFDKYGVVPTYVIDYPVAISAQARDILLPMMAEGRCEIGAHLHPWVTPPDSGSIDNFHSFPGNLPADLEMQKLRSLTNCIELGFGRRPTIYKAGRYGIGPATAEILRELNFHIDVSIVPRTDFSPYEGPDFHDLPDMPFETKGGIAVLPLSVSFVGALAGIGWKLFPTIITKPALRWHLPGLCARLALLERLRLSPEGHGIGDLVRQTRSAMARGQRFFMLTYHSSSLLPGGTMYVRDEQERRRFLDILDEYLAFFFGPQCRGRCLSVSDAARQLSSVPQSGSLHDSSSQPL